MRPRDGAKPIDLAPVKHAVAARQLWAGVGVVVKRSGDNSHFKIEDGDVLIEIDLVPDGEAVTARLGGFGSSGNGTGCWKIPAEGTEVAWICPSGSLDSDVCVVASLSSGGVPNALDGDEYVLVNPKKVHIESQNDAVEIFSKGDLTIESSSGKVSLTASSEVDINGNSYSLPKLETLLSDLATYVQAVNQVLQSNCVNGSPLVGYAGQAAALTLFHTDLVLGTPYKSTKAKNG